MDDIRRQDLKIFFLEMLSPGRLFVAIFSIFCITMILALGSTSSLWIARAVPFWIVILAGTAGLAYRASLRKRFQNRRYEALWKGCQDRYIRFTEVLGKLKKEQVADLREMPKTIRRISDSLYIALRRADLISHEVLKTERDMMGSPPAWMASPTDPQSKELYRVADRNIAEYRQQFSAVMAGAERAEAQSAVFMTTLDTLRMKMLGYRLVGKSPEIPSQDFLEALAEAKLQLQAIDSALEELELGPYPKQITVMPEQDPLRGNLTGPPPQPPGTPINRSVDG